MSLIPNNYKQVGHAGFNAFAPETNPPVAPNVNVIPVGPNIAAYELVGFHDLAEVQNSAGSVEVDSAASYRAVDDFLTANDWNYSGEIRLAAHQQANTIIGAALRNTSETWAQNVLGLPLFSFAHGFINDYGSARAKTRLCRGSLVNRLTISAQERQAVTANCEIWSHFEQDGAAVGSSIGEDGDGNSLWGDTLTWNSVSLTIGGVSFRNYISNVNIEINNALRRDGVRDNLTATPAELRLTPIWILPGVERCTLSVGFHTEPPVELLTRNAGQVVLEATGKIGNVSTLLRITIPRITFSQGGQQGARPDDSITYTTSFMARYVQIEWDPS